VRGKGLVDIIRIGVTDFRLTVWTHPHLQKIAEGAVAVLAANECEHAAAMDKMLTRQDWRGKGWSGSVPVQCLHHPQAPVAGGAGVGAVRRIRGDAGRAVPGDVHTSIVPRYGPGKHVVVEGAHGRTRCVNLNRSGPSVALIGGKRVLEYGVAGDLTAVIDGCLLPHGVEIASVVNRHRRKVRPSLDAGRTEFGDQDVGTVQATGIAHVRDRRTERYREAATDLNLVERRVVVNHKDVLDGCGERGKSAIPVGLTQSGRNGADLVVAHDAFIARKVGGDGVTRAELDACRRADAVNRRAVHHEDIVNKTVSAYRSARPNLVIDEVDAAAVRRVAVGRVPLAVNDCIWDAGVAASEGRTVVVRAGSTEVCERQVGKVEMPRRVHTSFGITAAKADRDLPFKSRGTDDPLEGLTAVEGVPDPASIGGKRAGHASVQTIRIRGIDPQALLETNPANAANDRMPEAWRSGP